MMEPGERRDGSTRLKKNVSKIAFRGKEKFMRTLGMGEETKDEIIDNYVHLVTKQQAQFHKFQRDLKQYLSSIAAMQAAADAFYKSLNEIYDDAWMGKDMISSLAKTTDLLYANISTRLNAEVMVALQTHLTQCNELKVKVQKRGRKLVDYDGAKRAHDTLKSAKKLDQAKLSKAQEHVNRTRETYETLNTELHQDLPDLYDSRVVLSTDVIGSIATAEKEFFTELAQIRGKLQHVLSSVKDAYAAGDYRIQRLHSSYNNRKDRPTLRADAVVQPRSRDHSESVNEWSENDQHSYHHATPQFDATSRNERTVQPPQPAKRKLPANDYVNIQIDPNCATPVNGNDDTPGEQIYEEAEYDEQKENNDKTAASQSPTPGPSKLITQRNNRERSMDTPSSADDNASSSSSDSNVELEVAPASGWLRHSQPALASDENELETVVKNVPPPVVKRNLPQKSKAETQSKRSTLLGLSKLWSRSSKTLNKADEDVEPAKQKKGGLFSVKLFKKSSDKSATLSPPVAKRSSRPMPSQSSEEEYINPTQFRTLSHSKPDLSSNSSKPAEDNDTSSASEYQPETGETVRVPLVQEPVPVVDDDYEDVEVQRQENAEAESHAASSLPVEAHCANADATSLLAEVNEQKSDDTSLPVGIESENPSMPGPERASPDLSVYGSSQSEDSVDVEIKEETSAGDSDTSSVHSRASAESNLPLKKSTSEQTNDVASIDIIAADQPSAAKESDADVSSYLSSNNSVSSVSLSDENELHDAPLRASSENPLGSQTQDASEYDTLNHNAAVSVNVDLSADKRDSIYRFADEVSAARSSANAANGFYENAMTDSLRSSQQQSDKVEDDGHYAISSSSTAGSAIDSVENNYENVVVGSLRSNQQLLVEDASDSVYMTLHETDGAKATSYKNADGYEDTVYDTIIVTSRSSTNDDLENVYESPIVSAENFHSKQSDPEEMKEEIILPPRFLHKAVAMYPYQGADEDELSFTNGDIIYVVEHPDPEDQDEGWQMGILKSSWENSQSSAGMAIFPENFTKRLD